MNVLIGIPVKNCGPWIEHTVRQIIGIDYSKDKLSIVFVENDSDDYSLEVIKYCAEKLLSKHNYKSLRYEKKDVGFHLPHTSRHDFSHMKSRMNSLRIIRNHIVDTYLENNDFLWWIDADYKTIPSGLLQEVVSFDGDIIMPRVEVDGTNYDGMTHAIIDGEKMYIDKVAEKYKHLECFYPMNLVECAAIVSRRVFDYGIRYDSGQSIVNGEDCFLQEGPYFSMLAKQAGFKLYGELRHVIIHQSIGGSTPFIPNEQVI